MIRTIILLILIPFSLIAQKWTIYNHYNSGLLSDDVRAVFIDNNDIKWFGTSAGLSILDDNVWSSITVNDNLAHNTVTAIASENNAEKVMKFWITTLGGVTELRQESGAITVGPPIIKENSGLLSNNVLSVAAEDTTLYWFGTDIGCSSFDGTNWAAYTTDNFLNTNWVTAIAAPPNDWTYIATKGGGVTRIKQQCIDAVTSASPLTTTWHQIASDTVNIVYIDKQGARWFGTNNGISKHIGDNSRSNWTTYTTDDGLSDNFVMSICQDSSYAMWFGTRNGLSHFDGESWKRYTAASGLSSNIINDLAVDKSGNLWIATNNGVTKLEIGHTAIAKSEKGELHNPLELSVYPNPFNMETRIIFSLGNAGHVELSIFNIAGIKIRQLINRRFSAGEHYVSWDGFGANGRMMPSGIYIARLISNNRMFSRKLVLVN